MTLRLREGLLDEIRREGERAYPGECCGVLAGHAGSTKQALSIRPVANRRTDDPHRYLSSGEDVRHAARDIGDSHLEIVGFYHSHPDHPAVPSAFDHEHAWPWYSYVIVQVNRGRSNEIASWVLSDDRATMQAESIDVFTGV